MTRERSRSKSPMMTSSRSRCRSPIMTKSRGRCRSPSPPTPPPSAAAPPPQSAAMKKLLEWVKNPDRNARPVEDFEREDNTASRETLLALTDGFYAGKWNFNQLRHGVDQICELYVDNPRVIEAASWAISQSLNDRGEKLELAQLVRANSHLCAGRVFYLTIKASDDKFYEAKVYERNKNERELLFIRPALHYPELDPKFLQFDAPDAAPDAAGSS